MAPNLKILDDRMGAEGMNVVRCPRKALGYSLELVGCSQVLVCGGHRAHPEPQEPKPRSLQLVSLSSLTLQSGPGNADTQLVGELDGEGFGLGIAPLSTKPGKRSRFKKMFKAQPR